MKKLGKKSAYIPTLSSVISTKLDNEGYLYANQPLIQSFITGFSTPIVTIDSAFIQARAGTGTDSAAVIAMIDSTYVQARTTAGTDRAAVLAMIDSAHIQGKIPGPSEQELSYKLP